MLCFILALLPSTCQGLLLVTKGCKSHGVERFGVVSHNLSGNPELGYDFVLKEVHDYVVSCCFGWYGLHPFGEVVGCGEDPLMTMTRIFLEFSNEIQAPLPKEVVHYYVFQGHGGQMLRSGELARLAPFYEVQGISEDGGPIVPCPQNLVSGGSSSVMSPAKPNVELL